MYEWKCKNCNRRRTLMRYFPDGTVFCLHCTNTAMVRVYSFSVKPSLQPHFNHATNTYISSDTAFRNELRRQSDEMSERLNLPVNYQPVDMRDKEALGVTEEGLESTYNRQVANGGDVSWTKNL